MIDKRHSGLNDNLLFSPDEIKYMRNEGRRPKIFKVIIICLLITTVGGLAYAAHATSSGATHNKTNAATTHYSANKSMQAKPVSSINASSTHPATTNQQVAPNQSTAPIPQSTNSSQPTPPVIPSVTQGCQVNQQALAQINQIGAEENQIAAQEGHIGDEEAQGNVYDPSSGVSYTSEIASLQQEAASLQQQDNVAQAQLGCQ